MTFYCKHCPRTTGHGEQVARTQGWRMYFGPTQGGGVLDDVVCPSCSGNEESSEATWDIECSTCGWVYTEEFNDGEKILAIRDVNAMEGELREHVCEPAFLVKAPYADQWTTYGTKQYWELRDRWRAFVLPPVAEGQQALDITPTSP